MSVPGQVKGAGNNSAAQNVIKVVFSEATADVPLLKAWDDTNLNSILHEIFTGTTGNGSKPILSAVATTDGAPASAWKPSTPVAGGATINRLKGNTNFVNLSAAAIIQGGSVRYNLCWEMPNDVTVPQDPDAEKCMDLVFIIEFTASGLTPTLTWYFNDENAGGTEAVPVWTQMTAGASGYFFIPTDAGVSSPNLTLHKPQSGTQDNPELWISST